MFEEALIFLFNKYSCLVSVVKSIEEFVSWSTLSFQTGAASRKILSFYSLAGTDMFLVFHNWWHLTNETSELVDYFQMRCHSAEIAQLVYSPSHEIFLFKITYFFIIKYTCSHKSTLIYPESANTNSTMSHLI